MISEADLEHIVDNMRNASRSNDKEMLDISIQDLKNCVNHYESLTMEFRFVSKSGDKVYCCAKLPDSCEVREVNGIINHFLISKYQRIFDSKPDSILTHFKHLNEMSPDEYTWCVGED